VSRQFPKVHADNQLFGPFGVTAGDVLAEERRLFYVAVTRAKHRLALLTETGKESPYLGAMQGSHLAGSRSDDKGRRIGAEAEALCAHLDRIERESLIRQNVSQQALSAWERLADRSMGLPDVGYSRSEGLYAELAWPTHRPPVAILTGRHRAHAARWREEGWVIHSVMSSCVG
jgi:DNA helicase IV